MKRKDHVPLSLKVSQRFGYPRVLSIPVTKMLCFWYPLWGYSEH